MAKGNAWKHRNDRPWGSGRRRGAKRELLCRPQFSFDDLYIPPFTRRRRFDEEGNCGYVALERNLSPTGILVMDEFVRLLASGGMDVAGFAAARGLTVGELGTMVFILTGMSGLRLRQLFQFRLADDLLRYTSLPLAEVARLSGNGSAINLYQTLRRECNMSASERRAALRNEGDLGRFAL